MKGTVVLLVALVLLLAIVIYEAMRISTVEAAIRHAEEQTGEAEKKVREQDLRIGELEGKLKEAEESRARAEEDSKTATSRATNLKVELAARKEEKEQAQEKIDALTEEKKALADKLSENEKKATELRSERDDLKAIALAIAEERDSLKDEVSILKAENHLLKTDKETLDRKLGETRKKLDRLTARRRAWRGVILYETGRVEEAAAEFQAALAAAPAHAEARKGLALCYQSLGKTAEARACWEEFIRSGPEEEDLKLAREHLAKLKE